MNRNRRRGRYLEIGPFSLSLMAPDRVTFTADLPTGRRLLVLTTGGEFTPSPEVPESGEIWLYAIVDDFRTELGRVRLRAPSAQWKAAMERRRRRARDKLAWNALNHDRGERVATA